MVRIVDHPPLKTHGGKFPLASWLHSIAPPSYIEDNILGYTHRNIVFAGGLGEFWNWLPIAGISESVNDINYQLWNFWRVIQNESDFAEFCRLAETTPVSQMEWEAAKKDETIDESYVADHPALCAYNLFVRIRMSRQGLGKDYLTPTRRTRGGMHEHVSAYLGAVEGLMDVHSRLRSVELRNLDFREFIQTYDHPRALFYLDPTYLPCTRSTIGQYAFEMEYKDHAGCLIDNDAEYVPYHELKIRPDAPGLLDLLINIRGKFMLSGYPSICYDSWAKKYGFRRHAKEVDNKASGKKRKPKELECVYTNY